MPNLTFSSVKPSGFSLEKFVKERRYLIASVASIGVMMYLLFQYLLPRMEILNTVQTSVSDKKTQEDRLQNKTSFLISFRTPEFKEKQSRINQILPNNKPFLQLLYSLEAMANKEGVLFSGLDISPGIVASSSGEAVQVSSADLQRMKFDISVIGPTQNVRSMIDDLSSIAPALDVESFVLTPSSLHGGSSASGSGKPIEYFQAKIKVNSLYAPILVSVDPNQIPQKLTADEEKFAETFKNYLIFNDTTEQDYKEPVGKQNPFEL